MAHDVIMPSLGFDMTEGKLARWLKHDGDKVERGQAIAEIETDKATVEVEATESGTLRNVTVQEGQTVPVGTVMAILAGDGEKVDGKKAAAAQAATAPVAPAAPPPAESKAPAQPAGRIKVSPVARKMAEQAGLDLAALRGSGPDGRITERDVEAALEKKPAAAPAAPAAPARPVAPAAPAPTAATVPMAGGSKPLNRMRQAIARRMAESKQSAPHFYVTVDIDMTNALQLREQLNALATDEEKLSVNDLIVAAVARTLRLHPAFNASFQGDHLQMHEDINIGIAVALEDGLIVPVLHDADRKSLKAIAAESKGLAERARANKLRQEDLSGATFSTSNLGMFGVSEFIAIINPPESAILATGTATKQPIVVNDEIKIAPVMKATLSVDHRVAGGAEAGLFMQDYKKLLENPVNLLL